MTAIRVIFDGKAFIPQQPVSLPDRAEAVVFVDQIDSLAPSDQNAAIRAYYESKPDGEDASWGTGTASQSHRAWEED